MEYIDHARTSVRSSDVQLRRRVLVVEDDPVHRKLMLSALETPHAAFESAGYEVIVAVDSTSALAILHNDVSRFELVILDMRIPREAGGEASFEEGLKVLTALAGRTLAVVVSGSLTDAMKARLRDMGVKAIFEKPFSLARFRESIDAQLADTDDQR